MWLGFPVFVSCSLTPLLVHRTGGYGVTAMQALVQVIDTVVNEGWLLPTWVSGLVGGMAKEGRRSAGDRGYAPMSSVLPDPRPNPHPRSSLPSWTIALHTVDVFFGKYLLIVDCITRHYSRNWGTQQ